MSTICSIPKGTKSLVNHLKRIRRRITNSIIYSGNCEQNRPPNVKQCNGNDVANLYFSRPELSVVQDRFSTAFAFGQEDNRHALHNLAKMLEADDICVVAKLSEYSNWQTVYKGCGVEETGIDIQSLLNAAVRMGANHRSSDSYWVPRTFADPGHALLISSFRKSTGEIFVVGLLFKISERGQSYMEASVTAARAAILSVVELSLKAEQLESRVDGSSAALDRLDVGIILLNENSEIVQENMIARRLLDSSIGIRRRGKLITATDLTTAVRLRVAMEHVLTDVTSDGTKEMVPLLTLKRDKGQRPLLASLFRARANNMSVESASAIMFVFDPEREISHLLHSACQLYRLSPVETVLACRLAQGESIAEAAMALKIKELTARGYLKQIFIKTGVNRQAALVRLLLSSIMHLGDDPELIVM